jgi:hypothetical protein
MVSNKFGLETYKLIQKYHKRCNPEMHKHPGLDDRNNHGLDKKTKKGLKVCNVIWVESGRGRLLHQSENPHFRPST